MSKKSPREYHLLRLYGISLADYNQMLKEQSGLCFVCKRPASAFKTNLCVDHDHKTGEIYGLLCHFCNHRFIGRNRNWEHYANASIYLKRGLGIFVPQKPKRKRTKKKSRKR